MKRFKQGAFLTRAQPVTLAHVECIQQMDAECNKALVIIGSANKRGTLRNPFSIELRMEMMVEAIRHTFHAPERISVIALDDIDYENSSSNPLWGNYLYDAIVAETGATEFAYYTGEPLEQSSNWFGNKLNREVTPRLTKLDHLPRDATATDVRNAFLLGDIKFVAERCPRSVVKRFYELLEILQIVRNNPLPDFSTIRQKARNN